MRVGNWTDSDGLESEAGTLQLGRLVKQFLPGSEILHVVGRRRKVRLIDPGPAALDVPVQHYRRICDSAQRG